MKRFKILVILLTSILLVGCGKSSVKEDVNPVTFQKILEENKYTVLDTTEQIGYASRGLYGYKSDIKINYVQGNKKYDIQGVFLDECTNVYNEMGEDYKQQTDGGKNWSYLIVTTDTNYYFVGWINDSYITITAPAEQTKKLNKLVEELGYK